MRNEKITYHFEKNLPQYGDIVTFKLIKNPPDIGFTQSSISGQFTFESDNKAIRDLFVLVVTNEKFTKDQNKDIDHEKATDRFHLTKEALFKSQADMEKYIYPHYSQDISSDEKNKKLQDLLREKTKEIQAQERQRKILEKSPAAANSDKIKVVLNSLEASLAYRQTLYQNKPEKIKKWNIQSGTEAVENKNRAAKLKATENLISYVNELKKACENQTFTPIDRELDNSRAAKNGALGEIRSQIKKARDAVQEITVKNAKKSFEECEKKYEKILKHGKFMSSGLKTIFRLDKILAELHYRKTLYIQRKNSHAHVHFFNNNQKNYKSAQMKLKATEKMIEHVQAMLAHSKNASKPKPSNALQFQIDQLKTVTNGRLSKILNEIRTVECSQGIEQLSTVSISSAEQPH